MPVSKLWICLAMALAVSPYLRGEDRPVKVFANQMLNLNAAGRSYALPLYISNGNLVRTQPGVTRALIVFHGKQRNANVYNQSGLDAIKNAGSAGNGTILITPQFLEQVDVDAYRLPPRVLYWAPEEWMAGANAMNAPLSSFDGIDAILRAFGNRILFPNLKKVVLVGHSAGGQLLQRYAVVGKAGDLLEAKGVHVRYVVANPSSYLYFSPDRPALKPTDEFKFAVPEKTCSGNYNRWKYGIIDPPAYAAGVDFSAIEARYVKRDVVYLLGTKDTDPNHSALDKSCSGESEGTYRFFRGKAYFRYLQLRHPELTTEAATYGSSDATALGCAGRGSRW